ncbi:MAG: hypothetical protein IPP15_00865 [Saprospiraceae bacterium]|uniref:Uncharacterized protein n=1 Tax=Candidatus Opimibacter skivensis TaxID=2982028 RepID=A0A9D7SPQ4_9BACT|nr:hypothetical protein [Candidatus Opimibacter skivensis]
MTTKQLISEINKVLDQVPDSALSNILSYLNSLKGKSEEEVKRASHLSKILEEDKRLLERLAK